MPPPQRSATASPAAPLEITVRAASTRVLLAGLAVAIGVAVGVDASQTDRVDLVRLTLGALASVLTLAGCLLVESRRLVLDPRTRTIYIERRRLLSARRQAVPFDGAQFAYREDRSGRSASPRARTTYQPLLRWPGGETPLSNQHSIARGDFAELERAVVSVLSTDGAAATAP